MSSGIRPEQTGLRPRNTQNPSEFKDNWSDILETEDKKIIKEYFDKFEELQDKIGFINFVVGKKDFNLKMKGPIERGITFELPRNSLVEACKYSIFDDLLIGNFMKTQLHNLNSLYDQYNISPSQGGLIHYDDQAGKEFTGETKQTFEEMIAAYKDIK